MRVISGLFKGKTINFLKNSTTRPLKDMVKENIFNILNHSHLINIKLSNSKILDAYSGVGSFGIECLSRGAKKVSFVESDKAASKILKENLVTLSVINKGAIFNYKIEKFLKDKKSERFNIFFFDPPFSDTSFISNLNFIKKSKMFENKHIIILHREKETFDPLEECIKILITRQYGRSKILFGIFN